MSTFYKKDWHIIKRVIKSFLQKNVHYPEF